EETAASAVYFAITPATKPLRVWVSSYAAAASVEIRALFKSVPFLLLQLLWIVLAATEIYSDVFHGEYDSVFYPTTGLILSTLRQPIALVSMILLIYYSAEIFWREHQYRMSPVINATPVPSSVLIAAKWSSLAVLIFSVVVSGIVPGIFFQIIKGYAHFEPFVYLSLFYFSGLQLILLGAAASFIHMLSPNKYLGMIMMLAFMIFCQRGQSFGFDHHLLRFATAPPVQYSDMNGFGHAAGFHWYMLYWSIAAGILILIASRIWRAAGATWRERLRLLRRSNEQGNRIVVVLACAFVAA
ncbi:MAG TPA: hypothetical protein VJ521_13065, partial [Acidobacteriota bacterium]|nr:hypothetical protein [Acidobacteriota bacterium]